MAIEYIKNQPVFFGTEDDVCFCEENVYSQLLNVGDITQFQLRLNTCFDSENLITNGSFTSADNWTIAAIEDGGWQISGGSACHSGAVDGWITSTVALTAGYYIVTLTVSSRTTGSLYVVQSSAETSSDQVMETNGQFTFFVELGTQLVFYATEDFDGCIDDIFLYEVDKRIKVAIYDNDGVFVNEISFPADSDSFVFDKDTVTISVDWETLGITDFGCYYMCILDPCINTNLQNEVNILENGDFADDDTGWTETAGGISFTIAGEIATFSASGAGSATLTNTGTTLVSGVTYDVTYTITSILDASVSLALGTVSGTSRTTNGTFTDTITADGNLVVTGVSTGSGAGFEIDDIIITVADSNYTCNLRSNDFKLGNHSCTIRINACNDEDALGFNFTTSNFSPVIRLTAALLNAQYPLKRKAEVSSAGNASVIFGNRRKTKKLIIESQPEYIHDFLSLLPIFDRFYIGSTAYFSEDEEYQVTYDDNEANIGSAVIEISEKTQLTRNLNIGNTETNCAIGDNFWIDENNDFVIDGSDGGLIIIN